MPLKPPEVSAHRARCPTITAGISAPFAGLHRLHGFGAKASSISRPRESRRELTTRRKTSMFDNTTTRGWRFSAMAALAAAAILTGCGGDDGGTVVPRAQGSTTQAGTGNSAGSSAQASVEESTYTDGIFVDNSGDGYFQFDTNFPATFTAVTGAIVVESYLAQQGDKQFGSRPQWPAGASFALNQSTQAYITADGAEEVFGYQDMDWGPVGAISKRTPQGFQFSLDKLPTPLYDVALTAVDVSGQAVADVLAKDSRSVNGGLAALMASDKTPMPAGSHIYQTTETVLTTNIWMLRDWSGNGFYPTLEAAQVDNGGTIRTLGAYRYLDHPGDNTALVEYNGKIDAGEIRKQGDVLTDLPLGYNRVAATFIAQEIQKALQPR
ncbi:hypothetical protein [Burkholderia gladioli]|uniref:hypothetical protein n=1 Tax=Burkholderia gladioli TaxID=28095 RepID=UPI001640C910|nr:hypothetical protein [Burkholderia gladioli]